jgi:hypothetical protein
LVANTNFTIKKNNFGMQKNLRFNLQQLKKKNRGGHYLNNNKKVIKKNKEILKIKLRKGLFFKRLRAKYTRMKKFKKNLKFLKFYKKNIKKQEYDYFYYLEKYYNFDLSWYLKVLRFFLFKKNAKLTIDKFKLQKFKSIVSLRNLNEPSYKRSLVYQGYMGNHFYFINYVKKLNFFKKK